MIWSPDSCACIVDCISPSKRGKFIVQCRTHNTTLETYAHNISFNENPTAREVERKLPQFQRS